MHSHTPTLLQNHPHIQIWNPGTGNWGWQRNQSLSFRMGICRSTGDATMTECLYWNAVNGYSVGHETGTKSTVKIYKFRLQERKTEIFSRSRAWAPEFCHPHVQCNRQVTFILSHRTLIIEFSPTEESVNEHCHYTGPFSEMSLGSPLADIEKLCTEAAAQVFKFVFFSNGFKLQRKMFYL